MADERELQSLHLRRRATFFIIVGTAAVWGLWPSDSAPSLRLRIGPGFMPAHVVAPPHGTREVAAIELRKADGGTDWPLAVESAIVGCVPRLAVFTSFVLVGDRAFAVSGLTRSRANSLTVLRDDMEIPVEDGIDPTLELSDKTTALWAAHANPRCR